MNTHALARLAPLVLLAACSSPPAPLPQHVATLPAPHVGAEARTQALAERARGSTAELLLIGDSITEGWETAGAAVWARSLAPRGAVNLGVSGDQTQHVLQRLQSGVYDALPARVVVLMIGTNNTGNGQAPELVADGVAAVVRECRSRWPAARVMLLAIFPRGDAPDDPLRANNAAVNRLLFARVAGLGRVAWLDFGAVFLREDGTLRRDLMPDALHLSEAGYELWADSMGATLARLRSP